MDYRISVVRRAAGICALVPVILAAHPSSASDAPVMIVTSSGIAAYQQAERGARERLQGQAVAYGLNGRPNAIPGFAEATSLIAPKGVIAIGSLAVSAIKAHPLDAPIVLCMVLDHPRALDSVARSWVVSMHVPPEEAYARISRVLPGRRIGIPYHPDRNGWLVRELVSYFRRTPIELVPFEVTGAQGLSPALRKVRTRIDALWIMPDPGFLDAITLEYLLRYAAVEALPLIGYSDGFTQGGALVSLVADHHEIGRQAADLVLRVTAGQSPARVQAPRRIRTVLNLRIAERLGITLTPEIAALLETAIP